MVRATFRVAFSECPPPIPTFQPHHQTRYILPNPLPRRLSINQWFQAPVTGLSSVAPNAVMASVFGVMLELVR